MVDIKPLKEFMKIITMQQLRDHPALVDMVVLKKGNRLSITPVTQAEYQTVISLSEDS